MEPYMCAACLTRPARVACLSVACKDSCNLCLKCDRRVHEGDNDHERQPLCDDCCTAVGNIKCEECGFAVCKVCFKTGDHQKHSPHQKIDDADVIEILTSDDDDEPSELKEAEAENMRHMKRVLGLDTDDERLSSDEEKDDPVQKDDKPVREDGAGPSNPGLTKRAAKKRPPSHVAQMKIEPLLPKAAKERRASNIGGPIADENMRGKIRKLLKLGMHPGTPEAEAKHSMRLAKTQLKKYNLDQVDIMREVENDAELGAAFDVIVTPHGQRADRKQKMALPDWMKSIVCKCANLCDVKCLWRRYLDHLEFSFYGVEESAYMAAVGFEATLNAACINAEDLPRNKDVRFNVTKDDYKFGVGSGLAKLVADKKAQEEEERQKSVTERSVIVYEKKHEDVAVAVQKELFPKVTNERARKRRAVQDQDAFAKGQEFGHSRDMKSQRIGDE